jgi:hypothetical protein
MTGQLVQALHVLVALEALVGPRLHKGGAGLRHILHTLLLDEDTGAGGLGARLNCLVPGLEKNPVFFLNQAHWVFSGFFWFFGFFCFFFIYLPSRESLKGF